MANKDTLANITNILFAVQTEVVATTLKSKKTNATPPTEDA